MSKVHFSVQVRLVSDLERSKRYYADVLGCDVSDVWAVRDDFALGFKLIQAAKAEDVRPNPSGDNKMVPWDTYAYVETHEELDQLYEHFKARGAQFIQEPVLEHQDWGDWKDFVLIDPDRYAIAFGSGKKGS
ncbi:MULTISPECIES: VOC family protein [Paenibacillus]|uniref:VOC domain-containing protein n=1 Tax=Paenibacillus cineris TaxID=237530 RepID=A0ABQ4L693_9BACL|nr:MULTISPECIES: VOC family protein [Paenibacillus]GIO52106.1 hypothetical protein J21TS7_04240 [Paenibacillus cineris]GIO63811.1 hypothetical protein J43TS9_53850 [Paenibacillus cineris]